MGSTVRMATEVRVFCSSAFSACILLTSPGVPEPRRVTVDSAEKISELDAWGSSSYQVYKRLSALATRVMCYYQQSAPVYLAVEGVANLTPGSLALENLLLWLGTYTDLHTRPCKTTGRLLSWEPAYGVPLPPILRAFKLTQAELRRRARDPSLREAYHMHLADPNLTSWAPVLDYSQDV